MRSKYEKKTHKQLVEEGFLVDYKARPFRVARGYSVDYFALFDLLAYHNGVLRLIAVKGHQGVPKALREGIKAFRPVKIQKEIWIFRDKLGVKREIIE